MLTFSPQLGSGSLAAPDSQPWPMRLAWGGSALVLHGLLFGVLLARPSQTLVMPPVPIQVSLLDPAPPAETVKPAAPEPVRPQPPKEKPLPKPRSKPAPAPVAETPVADPVPAQAAPAAASSTPAVAAAPAGTAVPVSEPRFDADYLNNPRPAYPVAARRLGEQGTALLRARVLPDGSPERVEIKQSSGSSRLDEAALAAVRKWRFVPARRGSEAVAAWVVIPISFRLES